MYTQHFKLAEPPFSLAPNPRYLYLSAQHREALAHLLYGIGGGGGFVALTGEVGTGKTTLCRCLLDQLPEDVDIALIFNPWLDSRELLASLCDELRISHPGPETSVKPLIDALNRHLLDTHAQGRRTIALIDEAQNLSFDVLEQIRLLTNLETNQAKLLQIILVGQPELNHLLERPDLRQLAQRITARYHLTPLSLRETSDYIRHRLAVAGGRDPIFSGAAVREIFRRSGGIPRLINTLCDRALLGAYSLGRTTVSRTIARQAARELLPAAPSRSRFRGAALGSGLVLAMAAGGAVYFDDLAGLVHVPAGKAPTVPEMAIRPAKPGSIPPGSPVATASMPPADTPVTPKAAPVPPPQATVSTPPSAPESPIPLAARLAGPESTRSVALARLLSLWKLDLPAAGPDACVYAAERGLRCQPLHGTWFQLRRFNLPAALELVLPNGVRRYAVLTRLRDGQVELALGSETRSFELAEVLPLWQGDAILVWKPPEGGAKSLTMGSRSETVRWVRQRLRMAAAPEGEDYFDAGLKARVTAFQTAQGLAADGVVGVHTMIYLGAASGEPGAPRLEAGSP